MGRQDRGIDQQGLRGACYCECGTASQSGHDHLDGAFLVCLACPFRPHADDFPIELHTDAPAHANHHRFAVHGFEPLFEVYDDVLSHEPQPFFSTDNGFELCPLGFELFLAFDFFAFGYFFEIFIDLWPFGLIIMSRENWTEKNRK